MERGSEGRKMGETKLREIALPRRSRPPRKKIFRISYFVEIGMRDGRFLSPPPRPCPRPFSCGRQENGQPSTFLSAAIPPPLSSSSPLFIFVPRLWNWTRYSSGKWQAARIVVMYIYGNKRERNEASQRNEDEEIEREYFFSRYFVSLKVYLQLVSK